MNKIRQLNDLYEEAKDSLNALQILEEDHYEWSKVFATLREIRDLAATEIQKTQQLQQQQWISVNERLPEEGEYVILGSARQQNIYVGYRMDGMGFFDVNGNGVSASHWMIPEPPKI